MTTRQRATRTPATRRGRRRGFSVLVVLLLIAVTLGLSYASIRTQSVNVRIQRNASFRASARSVALSGLATALRVMHTNDWQGVDTTLTGSLSPHENFEVRFTTGDPALLPGDAEFDRYPYRVTLDATGYAADPAHPASIAIHRAQAVVELIPRALSEAPAGLDDILDHTLSQWDSGTIELCVPFRVEGPVRFRGRLDLSQALNWAGEPWWWYHAGLNEMRLAGRPDWRPLTGPVGFQFSDQDSDVHDLIRHAMGVSTIDTPSNLEFTWQTIDMLTHYRLYPGGKPYPMANMSGSLENIRLEPDPETNPAGLFAPSGTVQFRDGVTIHGSLFTRGSSHVEVRGAGVRLEPIHLPALDGTGEAVRLPTLVSSGNIRFHSGSAAELKGLVLAREDVEVRAADQSDLTLRIEGHTSARRLLIRPRDPWDRSSDWWDAVWLLFQLQRATGIPWFPEWLEKTTSLSIQPRIVFEPNPQPSRYHYYHPDEPIYVPHPDDEGLRWNVVRWTMNP